jgi:hypothetical protein
LGNNFGDLAEHDGNMEQTPKSKKFEAPPPPPRRATPLQKEQYKKKMTAFDWPVNIISNAFNPKHVDAFYCRKKKIFMSNIAPLVFAMWLLNTPIITCYFVIPCQHSFFSFFSFVFCHARCYLDVFLLLTKLMSFLTKTLH